MVQVGIPFLILTPDATIVTLLVWGTHMTVIIWHKVSGVQNTCQFTRTQGGPLSLRCLPPTHPIQLCPNNVGQHDNGVLYKQAEGSKISPFLHKVVALCSWCISHHITLSAAYLRGEQNYLADSLSRHFAMNYE